MALSDGPGVKRWRTSMLPKNIQPGTLGQEEKNKKRNNKRATSLTMVK